MGWWVAIGTTATVLVFAYIHTFQKMVRKHRNQIREINRDIERQNRAHDRMMADIQNNRGKVAQAMASISGHQARFIIEDEIAEMEEPEMTPQELRKLRKSFNKTLNRLEKL